MGPGDKEMLCSESAEKSSSKGDKIPSPSLHIPFKSQLLQGSGRILRNDS